MICIDPNERITAKEALSHSFFYSLTELKKYRKNLISKISNNKDFILPVLNSHKRQN
jgi:serine/threonine protein kinase